MLSDGLVAQLQKAVAFHTPSMSYLDHSNFGVLSPDFVIPKDEKDKRKYGQERFCKYFNSNDKENLWNLIKFCHKVLSHMNANGDVRLGEHSNANNWEYDQYNLGKDIAFIKDIGERLSNKFFEAERKDLVFQSGGGK